MNRIARIKDGKRLARFDPERHRLTVAALNYGIEEAKRIKDWPKLDEAIDAKIEEQHAFVVWWGVDVQRAGGDRQSKKHSPGTRLMLSKAEALTGMSQQRVADLKKKLTKPEKYREQLRGAEYRAAMLEVAGNVRGTNGTGENEWFTPKQYLALARDVLGAFDLDPASSDLAQETVQAAKYFTKADDGLEHEWHGRVWLNPPYAQPFIARFVDKLMAERQAGRVTAAILLTHNYTDTAWFQQAAPHAAAICFTRGRVRFYEPDGAIAAPTQGQAFFYFGENAGTFASAFSNVGFVLRPWVSA